ncbi:MAG: tail fiber domain-containing protein [Saprospiraceae bacterium]
MASSVGNLIGTYSYIPNKGSGIHYGIYTVVPGTNNYAALFEGNVTVMNGTFSGSDIKLKENIQEFSGALSKIDKINVKAYNLKSEDIEQMGKTTALRLYRSGYKMFFPIL